MKRRYVYALGFFDGVHKGHQALLRACVDMARSNNAWPAAMTFDTHPQALISGSAPKLINTPQDRRLLLEHYSMIAVETLRFDEHIRNMSWKDFFQYLVRDLNAVGLVCGNDFRFGKDGAGTAELLQAACEMHGIPCEVVPEQTVDGVRVSSTHIRKLLEDGDLETAIKFMGHPHILTGIVVSGRQLGRSIGVPTANLEFPEGLVLPKPGVYACKVSASGMGYEDCMAVTNIGTRPTVGGHHVTVEPWVLDFDGDLYGKELFLEFHAFLRPEKKFASLKELKAEIQKDASQTRKIFEKNMRNNLYNWEKL